MNTELDELIAKHLNGTLHEEEKQLLVKMLRDPEHQLYLASKIDEQFFEEDLGEEADNEIGVSVFERIQERINHKAQSEEHMEVDASETPVVHISWYQRSAVRWMAVAAASIILVVSFVALWNNNRPEESSIAIQNNRNNDSTLFVFHHEVNNTGKDRNIQLPDGSLIVLADKSEVTYREPFTDKRDITLIGKANFKVAKDKTRPFTVISGAVSTTALGTEFTVTAFSKAAQITVRLYEGKVVIKPVEKEDWRMNKDYYLLPGQEFIYSVGAIARVRDFKLNETTPAQRGNDKFIRDNPNVPQDDGSWFMFNNQSLGQVLDGLEAFYNVHIIYDKKDVQNIYWTGQYNKSDSLETILKRIGIVHNLTITKKDTAFIISK